MKISLSPNQFFDLVGAPLGAGRLSVLLHGSDTPADVFFMNGENFVRAPNPLTLDDAGEQPSTLFMEASIYDIRVEKRVGDGTYEFVTDFQFGFRVPDVHNDTVVYGIDGLRHANPELGTVTVVGYDGDVDCGARTYIWDPSCTDSEDGGTVIAGEDDSGEVENGRWILLSDLRYMPCTYFGVKPGHEANMSALLSYLPSVGQWGIYMPPVPRFVTGDYTTPGTLSTTRTLAFDPGARFLAASFTCRSAEVTPGVSYVADFTFTDQHVAESSWFRTVRGFWGCNAFELHQSRTNYFEDNSMGNLPLTVQNSRITGRPFTMAGTGQLQFVTCEVEDRALSTLWYTRFTGMPFSDRWFADSSWDFGVSSAHRQVVPDGANHLSVSNFLSADLFMKLCAVDGVEEIELEGREVTDITTGMPFKSVSGGVIHSLYVVRDMELDRCRIGSLYLEAPSATLEMVRCAVTVKTGSIGILEAKDSDITVECRIDPSNTLVEACNCRLEMVAGSISRDAANHDESGGTRLYRCVVKGGTVDNDGLVIHSCEITDTAVRVIPTGSGTSYSVECDICGNMFRGGSFLAFVTSLDGSHGASVYECSIKRLVINGNSFDTDGKGVRMPFWAEDGEHRFMGAVTDQVTPINHLDPGSVTWTHFSYCGNSGKCPMPFGTPCKADGGAAIYLKDWHNYPYDMAVNDACTEVEVFALPAIANYLKDPLPDPVDHGAFYTASTFSATIPYRGKALVAQDVGGATYIMDFPRHAYVPSCAVDKSRPNDMFSCYVAGIGQTAFVEGISPIGAQP